MSRINGLGYLERKDRSFKSPKAKASWRSWWLIKSSDKGYGYINVHDISIPKEYVGKRVRFKIEVMK